nr:cellulase family glycosylhydrolase [Mycobacterium sp. URHB0044]
MVVGMATVAVSALGATALVTTPPTASMDVAMMAAIDESNTTIGIADSDLYWASPAEVDAALDEMQAMGINTVRIGIPWAGINPVPGYYNWSQSDYMINAADARGMGVLAVITTTPGWANDPNAPGIYGAPASPADFGEFAGLAAQRYAGKVGAYEIWNEPNAAPYYGPAPDPAGYTRLLQAAYPAIKAADPNATVVGGVVGSTVTYENLTLNPVTFVDQMYQAGAQGYFDALSFHPYQYTTPFSQGGYHPDSPINQLADIHDLMVANGDADKLVWASEYGEPTAVATEAQQAAYLQDMLTTWRTIDYAGPAFVYTLQDTDSSSTDPEATFGLIRDDGTWKPAAYVVRDLATSPTKSPTMAQPTLAQPTLVQPTLAEPTLVEPTLVQPAVMEPTSPTVIPATTLDQTRSTDLVNAPTSTAPTSTAPTSTAPTSTASTSTAPTSTAPTAPTATAPTSTSTGTQSSTATSPSSNSTKQQKRTGHDKTN